jgi:hypothetical protein
MARRHENEFIAMETSRVKPRQAEEIRIVISAIGTEALKASAP